MSQELLRKLTDADLQALAAGDMSKVSEAGLKTLAGVADEPKRADALEGGTLQFGPLDTGIKLPRAVNAALANVGAGMSDLGLGVRQLFASDKAQGLSDLITDSSPAKRLEREVMEKRKLDQQLAEDSFDMPMGQYAAKGLQMAGNIAPTLAIPVGSAVRGATALPRALGIMRGAATPAKLGTAALAADAALMGAATGAVQPVGEGESRGMNMALSVALGGALPAAAGGINAGRRMVTQAGGRERAGAQIASEIAGATGQTEREVLEQTLAGLRGAQSQATGRNIPLSTAATLRDPNLARLEAGSRARNGANWYDFDQNQARAVAGEFDKATAEAADLGARRMAREANITANKAAAFGGADAAKFTTELNGLRNNLQAAMQSAESSNPAVLSMLQTIQKEMDRLGPQFGPENLATIRHNLSGKGNPLSPYALQSAPRDSVATKSLITEIDRILNDTTGGKWQNVISGYAADSAPVAASKAAGRVRGKYMDEQGGVAQGVRSADPLGDVPLITEVGLGRAMNAGRDSTGRSLLSDPAQQRLESILDALRAQNIVQGVKRSATAGGGSNTASDIMAAQAANRAADAVASVAGGPAAAVGKGAMDALKAFANTQKDRALAEALQNPQQMIAVLERQIAAGKPLTPAQNQLLAILRSAPAAAMTTME